MGTLFTIIAIVFGLLQIILFFKIWQMTNDVSRIKNILESVSKNSKNDNIQKEVNMFSDGDSVINVKTEKIMIIKGFDTRSKKYHCYSESGIYEGDYKENELDAYDI